MSHIYLIFVILHNTGAYPSMTLGEPSGIDLKSPSTFDEKLMF